jgi:hypothetical protein
MFSVAVATFTFKQAQSWYAIVIKVKGFKMNGLCLKFKIVFCDLQTKFYLLDFYRMKQHRTFSVVCLAGMIPLPIANGYLEVR